MADDGVRIDFTPTFMGCPALETMEREMRARVAQLGAKVEVRVVLDDSWSTDRISPEGREQLRRAGFAPPTPRVAGKLELSISNAGSGARTAARRTRGSRTSSVPRRAARSATAASAASRSSSSRPSEAHASGPLVVMDKRGRR